MASTFIALPKKGSSSFGLDVVLESATSLAANFETDAVAVQPYSMAIVRATWIGADANNEATFVLEVSDDGTNWGQLGESGTALVEAAETQIWQILEMPGQYLRLVYTANGNSGGTVDVNFMGRH